VNLFGKAFFFSLVVYFTYDLTNQATIKRLMEIYLSFKKENKATLFEKYLKTQSGRAFAQKQF